MLKFLPKMKIGMLINVMFIKQLWSNAVGLDIAMIFSLNSRLENKRRNLISYYTLKVLNYNYNTTVSYCATQILKK